MSPIAKDGILNQEDGRSITQGHKRSARDTDRTRSPSIADDDDVKHEEAGPDVTMADAKPTYKSWKKKYKKMRIKFDQSMSQSEELYRQEQKALRKIKQLAIFNDRILDVLTDINNAPQIPPEKRIDVTLDIPSDAEQEFILNIDREPPPGPQPAKSLKNLIQTVPHLDFAAYAERYPEAANDLLSGISSPAAAEASHQQHPPSFLTADDIDNYTWEIDMEIKARAEERGEELEMLPTMAPLAREHNHSGINYGAGAGARGATPLSAIPNARDTTAAGASSISTTSRDFALRNPTSVYNWLRKHAPKTFLQDNEGGEEKKEKGGEKNSRKAQRVDDDDDDEGSRPPPRKGAGGGARKSTGEGGRASTAAARAKGERSSKRSSAANGKDKRKSMDETMYDLDDEIGFKASKAAANKGKRKRATDDDPGYRPKGGSSRRPAKKRNKNNSVGGASAGGPGEEDHVRAAMQAEIATKKKQAMKAPTDAETAVEAEAEA